MAGRPRGIGDREILRAAAAVIGRVGPAKLTLAAVAREVGLVPGTLVQRFGSKGGLLLALGEQAAKDADALAGHVREEHETALDALTSLVTGWMDSMNTPERFANHLAFLCMDLTDPQLHEHALRVHLAQRRAIQRLLTEAMDMGELRPNVKVVPLARSVQAIIAGAGLTWALERRGTLSQALAQELDTLLRPHIAPVALLEEA